eukprot:13474792-Alexandrium_andersonii.AAC.1
MLYVHTDGSCRQGKVGWACNFTGLTHDGNLVFLGAQAAVLTPDQDLQPSDPCPSSPPRLPDNALAELLAALW